MTGGATPELELILAEGAGLRGGYSTPETLRKRDRCRISQVSVRDGPFTGVREGMTYGALFSEAILKHGMLVIGIYRLHSVNPHPESNKRFVITNPPSDLLLLMTDYVSVDSA